MSSVCFTGKGLRNGKPYDRRFWAADANACGWVVHDKVFPHTRYLVASRHDTTKASAARVQGTIVIGYDEFIDLLDDKALTVSRDPVAEPTPDPRRLMAAIDAAADAIEGWGSF